jgi:hypothetical protein
VTNAAIVIVVICFVVFVGAFCIEFGGSIKRRCRRIFRSRRERREAELREFLRNPAVFPLRFVLIDDGRTKMPQFPAECEQHSPRSRELFDMWARTRNQRQCRGCGLWVIWELRAITAGTPIPLRPPGEEP